MYKRIFNHIMTILRNIDRIKCRSPFSLFSQCHFSSVSYSTTMRSLQHTCSCCQEVATSERIVQLSCPDNTEISFPYIHIDNCQCLKTECSVPGPSTMASTNVKSRRRRRWGKNQDKHLLWPIMQWAWINRAINVVIQSQNIVCIHNSCIYNWFINMHFSLIRS